MERREKGKISMEKSSQKKHFVLVHGICHGAWCWYKVVSLLKMEGRKVTALDLGACGAHPMWIEEILSLNYSLPQEERVVLVAHSFSGLCIFFAMQNFPQKISVAVFVTAYMAKFDDPLANLILKFFNRSSAESFMDCQLTFHESVENLPKSVMVGSDFLASKMYQHCQPEDTELARMLLRPNGFFIDEMSKESLLTEEMFGSIRKVHVLCKDDQVMEEEFQRYIINCSPPQEVKSIAEAGPMVMLSKAEEFCQCMQEIAEK